MPFIKKKFKKKPVSFVLAGLILLLALAGAGFIFSTSVNHILNPHKFSTTACGCPNLNSEGEFDSAEKTAIWLGQPITPLAEELTPSSEIIALSQQVLGESAEEKWIEINLTQQRLLAHQGDRIVYNFPVSSGKFGRTPTGEFRVWGKFKYTKMEGGIRGTGTYYYLANVPYTMYFYKDYGIHGTYWHNNFGHPMSHGCVNVSIGNAEKLFYWATPTISPTQWAIRATANNPGTRVIVHGVTPRN